MNPQRVTPHSPLTPTRGHRAVFLDRDGTICEEVGYLDSIERLHLIPGSAAAIKLLNERGLKAVVVTNQSGVARGFFSELRLQEVHRELERLLRLEGAFLDGIYYCPHHPSDGTEPYLGVCDCRKPASGLLLRAAADLGLDLRASYVIGDHHSDVECAQRVGAKGILVLTGHGENSRAETESWQLPPVYTALDLYAAVRWVIRDMGKG
jgi:D-glycero-D-manno-heptose 1,7-bisphosphate phosphatase